MLPPKQSGREPGVSKGCMCVLSPACRTPPAKMQQGHSARGVDRGSPWSSRRAFEGSSQSGTTLSRRQNQVPTDATPSGPSHIFIQTQQGGQDENWSSQSKHQDAGCNYHNSTGHNTQADTWGDRVPHLISLGPPTLKPKKKNSHSKLKKRTLSTWKRKLHQAERKNSINLPCNTTAAEKNISITPPNITRLK